MLLETAFICLALNTYHEAKNQSLVGQVATAQVVMNRVEDDRFPNTICEVVKAVSYTHLTLPTTSSV